MTKTFLGSLQSHLVVTLLLAILVPTSLVASLAYVHLADTIRSERIKTVGRVADARREQLVMVFQRARNRAEGLLGDLARRCGDPASQTACYRQGLRLMSSVFQNSGEGICITDADNHIVAAVAAPYAITAQGLRTSSSVGIAIYPVAGGKAQALMQQADLAMCQAKNKGRGDHQFAPYTYDIRKD